MAATVRILALTLTFLGTGCASLRHQASTPELPTYQRLFLTMPSHAAGFELTSLSADFTSRGTTRVSSRDAVDRAYDALRLELTGAGFDVVASGGDADAVLELTMGGIGGNGDAEHAFVAFRDGDSGRLLLVFRAHARRERRSVEELMGRIVDTIQETVVPAEKVALTNR